MTTQSAVFPSLTIRGDALLPQGAFAEAQAAFLHPDDGVVERLGQLLSSRKAGVVAHFYMDPELQGALSACGSEYVQISDSLLMADAAIDMARAGAERIVVLGVDFMSENVRAMLDASGLSHIPVYRVAAEPIGCSLAESAEALVYGAYLTQAAKVPRSLHVIYINTSLQVKARAHHLVPTITCTSSNVVKTVLQAAHQVPGLSIWFGPDTYMGENLEQLFTRLAEMDEATIKALHPAHDQQTVKSLLSRFHYFKQGNCVVHHMFGGEVVRQVEKYYADVSVAAHLEVPGEMFALALRRQQDGRGVVGSTSNILNFIADKVRERAAAGKGGRLRFILGTEAGMITSIVRKVQRILRDSVGSGGVGSGGVSSGGVSSGGAGALEAEIIFPVASEAVAVTDDDELAIVPGAAGGEGCSTAGGCATCPYMKMNSLDALIDLLEKFGVDPDDNLVPFHPRIYGDTIAGRTAADLGGEPILHMRAFQRSGELPDALVADIIGRKQAASE